MTSNRPGSREQADRHRHSSPFVAICLWLAGALRDLAWRHARAQQFRRDVEALSGLDDDQLKDIGLSRGQIEWAVAERGSPCLAARGDAVNHPLIEVRRATHT